MSSYKPKCTSRRALLLGLVTCAVSASMLKLDTESAFADSTRDTKQHPNLRDDLKHCDLLERSDPDAHNTPRPSSEDWLSEGSAAYAVAKQVFDTLTQDYGWSGSAACGVLANIRGESNFVPDRAQGSGMMCFGMDCKTPPSGFNVRGGGGLVQFTPYSKFTDSEYWHKIDTANGWGVKNQMAAIWNFEFADRQVMTYVTSTSSSAGAGHYGKTPPFTTLEEWLSTNRADKSAMAFQVGYERPAKYHPEREEWASSANAVFNTANIQSDESKWKINDRGDKSNTNGTISDDDDKMLECDKQKRGIIGKGTIVAFLNQAKQYCDDPKVGYSLLHFDLNPDVCCASLVWFSATRSGLISDKTFCDHDRASVGNRDISTSLAGGLEKLSDWQWFPFTSTDDMQPGDILIKFNEHTEIFAGPDPKTNIPMCYAAHRDYDDKPGDSTGKEVCYGKYWDNHWSGWYRKVK